MKIIAKIFGILFGIMTIVWGVTCSSISWLPEITISWVLGVNMIIVSMGSILNWGEKKDLGLVDNWTLAGSVISFSLATILIELNVFFTIQNPIMIYIFSVWEMFTGITQIGKSILFYKINRALNKQTPTSRRWWIILILGVIISIIGFISFFESVVNTLKLGNIVGFGIFVTGIDLLISQFEE